MTLLSACYRQILVHGEQNEMARLKAALIREYEDNDQVHIEVHNPRNTEAVTLNFRGEKLAKVSKLPVCLCPSFFSLRPFYLIFMVTKAPSGLKMKCKVMIVACIT